MAVVLHEIKLLPDAGAYRLDVSINGRDSIFGATVNADGTGGACDEKLFSLLADRGLAERGSSAQYHADLCLLLLDSQRGEAVKLPFAFGTDRRFPGGSRERVYRFAMEVASFGEFLTYYLYETRGG